jgi:thiol-disulfide isomerase/thioredoxin
MKVELYGSPDCRPCKDYRPMLERFAASYGYEFEYIDVYTDEGAERANALHILSTPATVFRAESDLRLFFGAKSMDELLNEKRELK